MMNRHDVKPLLFGGGMTAAAASSVLYLGPQLVDATAAQSVGFYGMIGAASALAVWAALELWPERQAAESAGKVNERQAPIKQEPETRPEPAPKPVAKAEPAKPAPAPEPEPEPVNDPDEFTADNGYKPQRYMLKHRDRIERFIVRKLAQIDGAKPWTVSPPFASLNSIVIDIDPRDRQSLLYSTDFSGELFTKLPEGSELRRAGRGRKYPSIIIPRKKREFIRTADALTAMKPKGTRFVIGYDDDMQLITADLAEVRHLLILGTTGSGKGIATHNALISLIRANSPAQLNVIIIDPKIGEFVKYDGIPHLLGERAEDVETAMEYLAWLVDEITRRQRLFADHGCNNMLDFNELHPAKALPRILLVFDELTRFYERVKGETEKPNDVIKTLNSNLVSLATAARSAGISLMLVTQNSKDTIPAKLLSELPGRLYFQMKKYALQSAETDKGDLDTIETLPGQGAGLWFYDANVSRIQAPSIFKPATELPPLIADAIKPYQGQPKAEFTRTDPEPDHNPLASTDELYHDVIQLVIEKRELNRKAIMEHFNIGAPRLRKMIEAMEADKVIGPSKGRGPKAKRDVIMTPVQYQKLPGIKPVQLPDNVVLLNR